MPLLLYFTSFFLLHCDPILHQTLLYSHTFLILPGIVRCFVYHIYFDVS